MLLIEIRIVEKTKQPSHDSIITAYISLLFQS